MHEFGCGGESEPLRVALAFFPPLRKLLLYPEQIDLDAAKVETRLSPD
jgi:hypothetical protein